MGNEQLTYLIGMAGMLAFAVSAVLGMAEKKVDLFTAVVLGCITACGVGFRFIYTEEWIKKRN